MISSIQKLPEMRWKLLVILGMVAFLTIGVADQACAQQPRVLRISTENSENHVQTKVVQRFADVLARRTQGRLLVQYHYGAKFFRDRYVIHAINSGEIEMAVPGTWQLDRYDPLLSALLLPSFFGQSTEVHHRLRDGAVGQFISKSLEKSLKVKVIGRWIDLGHSHLYTTGKIVSDHQDIAGMRIRIAGGAAIGKQLSEMGASPVLVPWPDLRSTLERGHIDGVITTHETVASAKLWSLGLTQAVEIEMYFAQYIPLVSQSFWDSLSGDLRSAIIESWEIGVDQARADALKSQADARDILIANGIAIANLRPEAKAAWRKQLLRHQSEIAESLGIPEKFQKEILKATVSSE